MKKSLSLLILLSVSMPLALNATKDSPLKTPDKKRTHVSHATPLTGGAAYFGPTIWNAILEFNPRRTRPLNVTRTVHGIRQTITITNALTRHPEQQTDGSYVHRKAKENKLRLFTKKKKKEKNKLNKNPFNQCNQRSIRDEKYEDPDNNNDDENNNNLSTQQALPIETN